MFLYGVYHITMVFRRLISNFISYGLNRSESQNSKTMPEIDSPEEKKKELHQSIDDLSTDFSREKLKKVKAMFKETSKTEAEENRYLQELVKRFTRLLAELPFAKKFKKNGDRAEPSKSTEKKSREISELLGKIMRSTE